MFLEPQTKRPYYTTSSGRLYGSFVKESDENGFVLAAFPTWPSSIAVHSIMLEDIFPKLEDEAAADTELEDKLEGALQGNLGGKLRGKRKRHQKQGVAKKKSKAWRTLQRVGEGL